MELVEEPEPLLGERERQAPRGAHRRRRPPPRALPRAPGPGRRRSAARRGCAAGLHAERGAHPGHQLDGQQRVAAEVEEVVVDADPLEAEHLGQMRAQSSPPAGAARRDVDRSPVGSAPLGRGQRLAIDLAVRRQRQRRPGPRTPPGTMYSGSARQRGARAASPTSAPRPLRHDVGDQPLVARAVLAGEHDRLRDAGVRAQRRLDLAELDPEAADLDLVVDAAEELERCRRAASGPGRRCGRAARRAGAERIGDEPLGGQLGPVE